MSKRSHSRRGKTRARQGVREKRRRIEEQRTRKSMAIWTGIFAVIVAVALAVYFKKAFEVGKQV